MQLRLRISLACVGIKGVDSECFRVDIGVRQGCIMSPWGFNVHMDAVMKEVKMGMGRIRGIYLEEERKGRLPGLLYVDDLRAMVGRNLKVNEDKNKVMY